VWARAPSGAAHGVRSVRVAGVRRGRGGRAARTAGRGRRQHLHTANGAGSKCGRVCEGRRACRRPLRPEGSAKRRACTVLGYAPGDCSGDAAQARSSAKRCQVSAYPMSVYMCMLRPMRASLTAHYHAPLSARPHTPQWRKRDARAEHEGAWLRTSMCGARCAAPDPFASMAVCHELRVGTCAPLQDGSGAPSKPVPMQAYLLAELPHKASSRNGCKCTGGSSNCAAAACWPPVCAHGASQPEACTLLCMHAASLQCPGRNNRGAVTARPSSPARRGAAGAQVCHLLMCRT